MTGREYMRWRAFEAEHGSFDPAADRRAAVIAKTLVDINRSDDDDEYDLQFFLDMMRAPHPDLGDEDDEEDDPDDDGDDEDGGDGWYGDEDESAGY